MSEKKLVVCSAALTCPNPCEHGFLHEKIHYGENHYCTSWDDCDQVDKKIRCQKPKSDKTA